MNTERIDRVILRHRRFELVHVAAGALVAGALLAVLLL